MKLRSYWILGLVLTAAAVGLWRLRDAQVKQREGRRAALLAYLQGPLSDLLEAGARARPLLLAAQRRSLKPQERERLQAAADQMAASARAALDPYAPWADDAFFEPLQSGLHYHSDLRQLALDWVALSLRPELIPSALEAEQGLRRSLAGPLQKQRDWAVERLDLDKASVLEMNALIYTLRESIQP
jgi:hypothetical protein